MTKVGSIPRKETPTKQPPVLPLELEDIDKEKRTYVSHSLRTLPTQADSPTYKMYTLVLDGTETVREIIGHPKNIKKVLTGLNVTTIANKLTLTRTLLKGNALTQFNASVQKKATSVWQNRAMAEADDAVAQQIHDRGWDHADNYHVDHFDEYLNGMIAKLVPAKTLAKVKRFIRRNCRKPVDMSIRTYWQNLYRINEQEIPALPPFDVTNKFRDDELIDIISYGTPKSWAKEMDRQGFDPMDKNIEDVIAFMEQLEASDDFDRNHDSKKQDKKPAAKKHDKSSKGSSNRELKYCEVHGKCGHTTAECRTKKAKTSNGDRKDSKGKFSNKSWKRSADDDASYSKKEVAMLIKKMVKGELNAADKKRKASKDDSSEGSVFNIDSNLDGFNYDEMDKMDIHSDGEVSV